MTGRCGLVASMLVAIVVMAASSAWAHERPFRIIVAFSASACPRGGSPLPQVEAESDLMLVKLRSVATNADVVGLPAGALGHRAPLRKKELLDAIKADRRPLWLTYSGHATVTKGQSSLCLGEATVLPVADVLDAIDPAVPFATVLLNACSTAAVDPRRSNLVVISASPDEVTTTLSGSVLGERLLATLRGTYDTDGDGVFSSMELFEALRGVHIHEWPAQTKIRQQAWSGLPLFGSPRWAERDLLWLPAAARARETGVVTGALAPPIDPPPIVWLAPLGKTPAVLAGWTLAVPSSKTAVLRAAALVGSTAREVATEGDEVVLHDPQTQRTLRVPRANVRQPYEDLLWSAVEPGLAHDGGPACRFVRPLRAGDRIWIEKSGLAACPCAEERGQCFCGRGACR